MTTKEKKLHIGLVQSTFSKIYWGSPVNLSISYRDSISYSFVYTISNKDMFIYITFTYYMYTLYTI